MIGPSTTCVPTLSYTGIATTQGFVSGSAAAGSACIWGVAGRTRCPPARSRRRSVGLMWVWSAGAVAWVVAWSVSCVDCSSPSCRRPRQGVVSGVGWALFCCVVVWTSADALVLVGVVWLLSQHRQTLKFNFIDGIGKLKATYIAREMKALKQNRDAVRELVSAQRWCGGSARCGCDADGSFAAAFARVRYGAPELPVASAFQAEPRRHAQWLWW